jgi:hypothetical protein
VPPPTARRLAVVLCSTQQRGHWRSPARIGTKLRRRSCATCAERSCVCISCLRVSIAFSSRSKAAARCCACCTRPRAISRIWSSKISSKASLLDLQNRPLCRKQSGIDHGRATLQNREDARPPGAFQLGGGKKEENPAGGSVGLTGQRG